MTNSKVARILLIVLLVISVGFLAFFYFGPSELGVKFDPDANDSYDIPYGTSPLLVWSFVLSGIAAVALIVFSIGGLIMHPKKLIYTLVGIGALGVVTLVSYLLAGQPAVFIDVEGVTQQASESVVKWSGTGLNAMYLLLGLSVLSIIFTSIVKMFK